MSGSPWKSVRRLLPTAIAVFLFARCDVMSVDAAAPRSPSISVPPAPQPMPASSAPAEYCECDSDFWIVSSRRCPQKSRNCCIGCRFDHYHYTGKGCQLQQNAQSLKRWLKPDVPICVIVHGSFVTFDGLMTETRQMARWIRSASGGRPLQIVYFTWPSDGPLTRVFQIDISNLGQRSAFNGIYLSQFVSTLPANARISLIGHSHGARMVSAALHLLGGGVVRGYRLCKPGQCSRKMRVVFLAAAFDHHWLNPGERYGRAFCPVEALLNIRNERDLSLLFYPLRRPFSSRALARTGFTRKDQARLGETMAKVSELDATPLVGRRHLWQYYFQRPEIAASISPYIYFTDEEPAGSPAPASAPVSSARSRPQTTSTGWRRARRTSMRTSRR